MGYPSDPEIYYGDEEGLTTFQVWTMAFTSPSEETYARIVRDPNASIGRALMWFVVASFIGSMISVLANAIFGSFSNFTDFAELGEYAPMFEDLMGTFGMMQLICIPVGVVIGLIIFLFHTGVIHFIAGALGGTGNYSDLIYSFAAFTAPFSLVYNLILAIPVVQCFGVFTGFYALFLGMLALKVVHRFEWGKVIGTYAILIGMWLVFFCILAALMMGFINQVFQAMGA
jgi:hypothetical protein